MYVRLPPLLSTSNVGLIVIDSIAGVFRSENVEANYVTRSSNFNTIASKLIELGKSYKVAIVCTNQVSFFLIIIPTVVLHILIFR